MNGGLVPVDHGYALFSALSGLMPWIHKRPDVGIFNLRGKLTAGAKLDLSRAHLRVRCPAEVFGQLIPLAGKDLHVGGSLVSLGVPAARPLTSPPVLAARVVTIKKFMEEVAFAEAVQRHLLETGCEGRVELGRRRVVTVAGQKIVGFQVAVSHLSPAHSIRLQERGLGGRRHMGCGLFLPRRIFGSIA